MTLAELADSIQLATVVGAGSRHLWSESYDLRRIPVVDPTPVYPMSVIWRADNPHPVPDQIQRQSMGARLGTLRSDPFLGSGNHQSCWSTEPLSLEAFRRRGRPAPTTAGCSASDHMPSHNDRQIEVRNILCATKTFGDILAGEFDVDTPRDACRAHCAPRRTLVLRRRSGRSAAS